VYLYNVVVYLLLGEKNLETGAADVGDKWIKGQREILPTCPPPPPGLHHTLPLLPLHLLLIIIILLLLLLIVHLLLLFKEV
jgi:hypothetical protein